MFDLAPPKINIDLDFFFHSGAAGGIFFVFGAAGGFFLILARRRDFFDFGAAGEKKKMMWAPQAKQQFDFGAAGEVCFSLWRRRRETILILAPQAIFF